jgi:hypothetical protein
LRAATLANANASRAVANTVGDRSAGPSPRTTASESEALGNQATLRRRAQMQDNPAAPAPVTINQRASQPLVSRDADDDTINDIEGAGLDIGALLDRCAKLAADQRDRMITRIGDNASQTPRTTHNERQLAALLAVKFKPSMKRADFYNTYHELLERLPAGEMNPVLDYVGPEVIGKASVQGKNAAGEKASVTVDKRSINDKSGMDGAPGSSIFVDKVTYVVVDGGVQYKYKELDKGGPAGRNNNPGNITVDDGNPDAWDQSIGAYRGRNTDHRFAIFPTLERGKAGAKAWAIKSAKMTLIEYFNRYAPESEPPNKPGPYADGVAKHVSVKMGGKRKNGKPVDRNTPIQEIIDADAMDEFVDGQIEAEGFYTGNLALVSRTDPKLPKAVRDFVGGFDTATDNTNAIADKVAQAAAPAPTPAPTQGGQTNAP